MTDSFMEASTSRTAVVDGMTVHYHEVGSGYPLVMLHSYGRAPPDGLLFIRCCPRSPSISVAS